MNNRKMFSVLAIVMAVVIAPASGAFAQSDVAEKSIDRDEQKRFHDRIKEQRLNLQEQIREFHGQKRDRLADAEEDRANIEPTVLFDGKTSGWAVINGQAYPAEFTLNGKAGQTDREWHLTGTGTVYVGEREISFDLKGVARNNHIGIKGVSQNDDSIIIHLRGSFAPIAERDNSFALAFTNGAITVADSDVKVPLVLVGHATVKSIVSDDDIVSEGTDFEFDIEQHEDVLSILT